MHVSAIISESVIPLSNSYMYTYTTIIMIRDLLVKIHVPPHIVYIHLLINLTLLVGVPAQGVRAHPLPSSVTSFNNGTSSGGGGGEGGAIGSECKGFTHERLKKQKIDHIEHECMYTDVR